MITQCTGGVDCGGGTVNCRFVSVVVPFVLRWIVSPPPCSVASVFMCGVYRHWKRANLPEGCDEFEREQD